MYTEQDLSTIRTQQRKRWLLLAIPCLILLGVVIYAVTVRNEWLTSGATVLMGVLFIFFYDLTIHPLHCYETLVHNALYGRKHELECTYHSFELDPSLVDGVKYYGMTVLQPDEKGDPFERLLYWDAQKPQPADLHSGDLLRIIYHDRMVVELIRQ